MPDESNIYSIFESGMYYEIRESKAKLEIRVGCRVEEVSQGNHGDGKI